MPNTKALASSGPEPLDFELIYAGPEVDDGSIRSRDLVNSLTGMTETFSRVSSEYDSLPPFEMRVRDLKPGSVEILLRVVEFAKAYPAATAALAAGGAAVVTLASNLTSGAYRVLIDVAKLIDAKVKLRGQRVATTQATFDAGKVILLLPSGPLELTKEQYELLLSRRVDAQLSKLVSPLDPGKVDSLELRQSGSSMARVAASERSYFDHQEPSEEKTREEDSITGTLNSLSKTKMNGTFYTKDGVHVPYKYTGGDLAQLYRGFAAREPVKVQGKVKYGPDGIPSAIEVESIQSVQTDFFS